MTGAHLPIRGVANPEQWHYHVCAGQTAPELSTGEASNDYAVSDPLELRLAALRAGIAASPAGLCRAGQRPGGRRRQQGGRHRRGRRRHGRGRQQHAGALRPGAGHDRRGRRPERRLVPHAAELQAGFHRAGAAHDDPAVQLLRRRRARRGHAEHAHGAAVAEVRRDARGQQHGRRADGGGRLHHESEHPVQPEHRWHGRRAWAA